MAANESRESKERRAIKESKERKEGKEIKESKETNERNEGAVAIRGVEVWDPFTGRHWRGDVLVAEGRLVETLPPGPVEEVNGRGLWLVPRLTDLHAHVWTVEPDWPDLEQGPETLTSALKAAVAGGFTAVAVMPTGGWAVDAPELVTALLTRSGALGLARAIPVASLSPGGRGQSLAPLASLALAGAAAFSDGASPSPALLRSALTYAQGLDRAVITYPLERALAGDGVVHEGPVGAELGLPGIPDAAEAAGAWREVQVAALAGGALHLSGISTDGALEALAWAKARGLGVSADVCPLHLLLTDEAVAAAAYHPAYKLWPPLRPAAHRQALRAALKAGTVEALASHHTPHLWDEVETDFLGAPFGASGLEVAVGAAMTACLAETGMDPLAFWRCWTVGPQRVLGLRHRGVQAGEAADLTLIDPKTQWQVDPARFYSRGRNTPLAGTRLRGRPVATMVNGRWRMRDGEVMP